MEEKAKKKKHTGIKVLLGILAVFIIALGALAIRFYPVYGAATFLEKNLTLDHMEYSVEVEINRDELEEKQAKLLDGLASITGMDRDAMYRLKIEGSVDGDIIHACIYPDGQTSPLIELYLSDDTDVINGAILYNAVRENYCGQNPMLTYLIPVWSDHEYVTLEQAEQMLEVDLSTLRDFRMPFRDTKLSAKMYFAALAVMQRENAAEAERYYMKLAGLELVLRLNETEPSVEAELDMEKPAALLEKYADKLSLLGVSLDSDRLRIFDAISATVRMEKDGTALQIPENVISQNTVDIISGLRSVVQEISGR